MINLLIAACVVGLAGSVHCIGMCGGIISLFSARLATTNKVIPIRPATPARRVLLQQALAYNLGRITTYSTLGAVFGSIGTLGTLYQHLLPVEHLAFMLANIMIILIGLFMLGAFPIMSQIEALGGRLWRRVQTPMRVMLTSNRAGHRIALGLLWGFVPCGMIYTMLLTALFSGSALNGAALMLAFGLGTLPGVLGLSIAASIGQSWLARHQWRRWAGALIIVFGLIGLLGAHHGVDNVADLFCKTPSSVKAP